MPDSNGHALTSLPLKKCRKTHVHLSTLVRNIYLRNVNSGHPGSITSVHATSAELAFEQLVLLVKQNPGGRELARSDIKSLLYMLVDVVIQFGVERHERFIKEIWYDPERKRR